MPGGGTTKIQLPVVVVEADGRWARPLVVRPPKRQDAAISAIACAASAACVAVGSYGPPMSADSFTAARVSGHWQRAVPVPLPPDAATSPTSMLTAVACPATGSCAAAGRYLDRAGRQQAFVAAESGAAWEPEEIAAPPAAAPNPYASITSISCAKPGTCVAVGQYVGAGNVYWPMAASESNGRWARAVTIAYPAGTVIRAFEAYDGLASVSCPASGFCVAIGSYDNGRNARAGMAVTWAAGRWSRPVPVTTAFVRLSAVSCSSRRSCEVVGYEVRGRGSPVAIICRGTGTRWASPVLVPPPPDAVTGDRRYSVLGAVSCGSGQCTATGAYLARGDHFRAMTERS